MRHKQRVLRRLARIAPQEYSLFSNSFQSQENNVGFSQRRETCEVGTFREVLFECLTIFTMYANIFPRNLNLGGARGQSLLVSWVDNFLAN